MSLCADLRIDDPAVRALLEQLPLPISAVDATGRVLFVNERASQMSGYTIEHIPTLAAWRERAFPDPVYRQTINQRWDAAVADAARTGRDIEPIDFTIVTQRAEQRHVTVSGLPVRGGFLAIFVDHTERKRTEIEREQLESQVREAQKLQAVGTLAGGVAHEFNNLLAVVLGHLSLAKTDTSVNATTQEHLQAIEGAAQDARQLVQQMLAFGRRQARDLRPTALAPLIRECLALLEPSLPIGVTLEFDDCPDAPPVLGDPLQLKQVLINLGINAAYAMRNRPGRITIRLGSATLGASAPTIHRRLSPGRHLVVTVTDQGCGMSPQTQARIFEPFFTTKPVGKGTGLGLSVVDGIIDTHGGSIFVNSAPGRGSTFSIYLRAMDSPIEASAPTPAPPLPVPAGSGQHILFVDDQASLLPMIRSMIESLGYAVTTHADPSAALVAFRAHPGAFDAVLTDFKMPGMTGVELARAMRRLRTDIPIALVSGYAAGEFIEDARHVGIDEFIYKPSIADELPAVIGRLLALPAASAAATTDATAR